MVEAIVRVYVFIPEKMHEKYSFLQFLGQKPKYAKLFLIYLKLFFETFSMPFLKFQNVYFIRRYSTKNPRKRQKNHEKYSFLHFFGLKTKNFKNNSDLS